MDGVKLTVIFVCACSLTLIYRQFVNSRTIGDEVVLFWDLWMRFLCADGYPTNTASCR